MVMSARSTATTAGRSFDRGRDRGRCRLLRCSVSTPLGFQKLLAEIRAEFERLEEARADGTLDAEEVRQRQDELVAWLRARGIEYRPLSRAGVEVFRFVKPVEGPLPASG